MQSALIFIDALNTRRILRTQRVLHLGTPGRAGPYAYQAAKGAILNVSKNVTATHGPDGIRCNSLHPGYFLSPMNEHQAPEINTALIAGTVLKRPGQPIETAYAALFLASDGQATGPELRLSWTAAISPRESTPLERDAE
jgi:NAD(P)-dependent dehydrogenase (short-subunit alcohol dehydrogenase family)